MCVCVCACASERESSSVFIFSEKPKYILFGFEMKRSYACEYQGTRECNFAAISSLSLARVRLSISLSCWISYIYAYRMYRLILFINTPKYEISRECAIFWLSSLCFLLFFRLLDEKIQIYSETIRRFCFFDSTKNVKTIWLVCASHSDWEWPISSHVIKLDASATTVVWITIWIRNEMAIERATARSVCILQWESLAHFYFRSAETFSLLMPLFTGEIRFVFFAIGESA